MYTDIKKDIKQYLKQHNIECDESLIENDIILVTEYKYDGDTDYYNVYIGYKCREDVEQCIRFNTVIIYPMWGNSLDLTVQIEKDTDLIINAYISNCNEEGLSFQLDASKLPLHLTKGDYNGNDIIEITTDNLFKSL